MSSKFEDTIYTKDYIYSEIMLDSLFLEHSVKLLKSTKEIIEILPNSKLAQDTYQKYQKNILEKEKRIDSLFVLYKNVDVNQIHYVIIGCKYRFKNKYNGYEKKYRRIFYDQNIDSFTFKF